MKHEWHWVIIDVCNLQNVQNEKQNLTHLFYIRPSSSFHAIFSDNRKSLNPHSEHELLSLLSHKPLFL